MCRGRMNSVNYKMSSFEVKTRRNTSTGNMAGLAEECLLFNVNTQSLYDFYY